MTPSHVTACRGQQPERPRSCTHHHQMDPPQAALQSGTGGHPSSPNHSQGHPEHLQGHQTLRYLPLIFQVLLLHLNALNGTQQSPPMPSRLSILCRRSCCSVPSWWLLATTFTFVLHSPWTWGAKHGEATAGALSAGREYICTYARVWGFLCGYGSQGDRGRASAGHSVLMITARENC